MPVGLGGEARCVHRVFLHGTLRFSERHLTQNEWRMTNHLSSAGARPRLAESGMTDPQG